jgi:hypothetical protein
MGQLEVLNRRFSPLAFTNIDRSAVNPQGRAASIAHQTSLGPNPAQLVIGTTDAILPVQFTDLSQPMHIRHHSLHIVGVNTAQPEIGIGLKRLGGIAVEGFSRRIDVDDSQGFGV